MGVLFDFLQLSFRRRCVGWGMPRKEGLASNIAKPRLAMARGRNKDFGDMYIVLLPLPRQVLTEFYTMGKMLGGFIMLFIFFQNPSLFFVMYMCLQLSQRVMMA